MSGLETSSWRISRGELLKRGAAAGVVMSLPAIGTATAGAATSAPAASGSAVLTADQSATLAALLDRLIPADTNGPSATQAGVNTYIEHALSGGLGGGIAKSAPVYTAGLTALDAYATSAYGGKFASLPAAKQDQVVADLAAGKATGFEPSSTLFFTVVHEHALQGMFGDPVYRGNKSFAGWKLLRYPGVRMPVPPGSQKVGANVPLALKSTYAGGQFPRARRQALS